MVETHLDSDDHFAAFRDPASLAQWRTAIRRACDAIVREDGTGAVRVLLLDKSGQRLVLWRHGAALHDFVLAGP